MKYFFIVFLIKIPHLKYTTGLNVDIADVSFFF